MERIREYRIIEKLGEGGMGEVYLAEDENLGRQVAIKMLAPELMRNAELVERFKQEARLQASLIHPNIVALHTFFVEGGTFYMVMEYAKGETLAQRLKRVGLLPPYICIPIFNQILSAVGFAHEKGIIHRDLKPSNIIIDQNNNVKVMDFGIAKVLGDRGMTKTGTKMGTLNYMSPEQIMGEKDIDLRTDIFSLGITFYEMLTGKLPYETKTESDFMLMQQIVENKIPSVKESYPYVPDKVDTAIAIATQKSKGDRFNSCYEFNEYLNDDRERSDRLTKKPLNNYQESSKTVYRPTEYSKLDPKKIKNNDIEEYEGVKGWLLFYCILSVIFVPIQSLFIVIKNIELLSHIRSTYATFFLIEIFATIILALYRISIGIKLWNRSEDADKQAQTNLIITYVVGLLLGLYGISFSSYYTKIIYSYFIVPTVGFLIWYNYFKVSKRVKATYK